ncbi:uncharacterized protein LOC118802712 [Colossoma macropomum]|uniref:uncharacterized protein LOC118802712 n=1 Tax=Colossoma macropomum TaxID=42526 RepID=UPI0018648A3F|nr:uncharacterized protein LOC118802712 [Colossoma macropomum]
MCVRSCAPARVVSICQDSNMAQASPFCGGVSLLHTAVDGKHHYKVKNVLTHAQSTFARKGDKILMINGVKTEDLPPEKFTSMLKSGSPILTIHQASIDTGINECLESDAIQPYRKEEITLHFNMAMVREECLEGEENGIDPAVCELESDWENGSEWESNIDDEELLLVSMNETSIDFVSEGGCDPHGCNLSEVVVTAETCDVTSVGREYIKKFAKKQHWIRLVQELNPQNFFSAKITINYYISNILPDLGRGVPVVLNFTGSNTFLKCTLESGKVVLKTECCDERQLQKICKDNEQTWPFVFYFTTVKDSTQHFESAAHKGWFIQTTYPKIPVVMENRTEQNSGSFYFVISSKSSTSL